MRHGAALAAILVLVVLVGAVLPVRTERRLERLRRRLDSDPAARLRFYYRYLAVVAVSLLLYVTVVEIGGEGFVAAGAGWPGTPLLRALLTAVLALAVANVVLVVAKLAAQRFDPGALDRDRQLGRIRFLLPHTDRERRLWPYLAVGIALQEEALFRGLFVLYLAAVTGGPAWAYAILTAFVFAAGHRYQAWLGVVASGALGLAFGILTAGLGSLWPAVALHALVDLKVGLSARPEQPIG